MCVMYKFINKTFLTTNENDEWVKAALPDDKIYRDVKIFLYHTFNVYFESMTCKYLRVSKNGYLYIRLEGEIDIYCSQYKYLIIKEIT